MSRRPGVEDPVDPAVEIGENMRGRRRADAARTIGRRRGERRSRRLDQRAGRLVRRNPERERIEAGAREQAHPTARRGGRDQGERPGPEGLRQLFRVTRQYSLAPRRLDVEDMGDERIEGRASLGRVNAGDANVRRRVGREAIDRLGRHRDQAAGPEASRRRGDRLSGRRREMRRSAGERHASS